MAHEAFLKRLTFNADGHVPAVIQDESGRVLTLCYMNREAIVKTLEERFIYVYRRSLGRLMKKGETSGHVQQVLSVAVDCEGKSLLVRIRQHVAACHRGYFSCYFEEYDGKDGFEAREQPVFSPDKVYK